MLKYLNIYSKSDPKLVSEGGVKTRILMLNMNCSRTNETRLAGLQFVCQVKKNWITWKRPTSQDSVFTGAHYHNHSWAPGFHSCSPRSNKKLLGRPGIEIWSTAWKAAMLTTIPPTLLSKIAIKYQAKRGTRMNRTDMFIWCLIQSWYIDYNFQISNNYKYQVIN